MEFFKIRRDIPFMENALIFNVVSFLTFAAAVFFLFSRGLHLSVEFTGGTVMEVSYSQPADVEKVRTTVAGLGFALRSIEILLGGEGQKIVIDKKPFVIMLVGLFGNGKTTTAGKLAKYYTRRGHKVTMLSTDTWRPAAAEQLLQLGKQINGALHAFTSKAGKLGEDVRVADDERTPGDQVRRRLRGGPGRGPAYHSQSRGVRRLRGLRAQQRPGRAAEAGLGGEARSRDRRRGCDAVAQPAGSRWRRLVERRAQRSVSVRVWEEVQEVPRGSGVAIAVC